MRKNEIRVSNTPIFDQLARERGYERMVASDLEAVKFAEFRRPMARLQASQDRLVARIMKIRTSASPEELNDHGQQTDEVVNAAEFKDYLTDDDVEKDSPMEPTPFEKATLEYFSNKPVTPGMVRGVSLKRKPEVVLEERETPGQRIHEFVNEAMDRFRAMNPAAVVTGVHPEKTEDGGISMVIQAVTPITSIGEDEPDSLYVKPQFWNTDDQE